MMMIMLMMRVIVYRVAEVEAWFGNEIGMNIKENNKINLIFERK